MRWDQHLQLGQALCKAWGLDAMKVRGISIDISVDGTTVLVEYKLPHAEVGEDLATFEKYHLVLNEEHRDES